MADEDNDGRRARHDIITSMVFGPLDRVSELFILVEARAHHPFGPKCHSAALAVISVVTLSSCVSRRESPDACHQPCQKPTRFSRYISLTVSVALTDLLPRVLQATYSGIPVYEL
jgi:hypothetical protein